MADQKNKSTSLVGTAAIAPSTAIEPPTHRVEIRSLKTLSTRFVPIDVGRELDTYLSDVLDKDERRCDFTEDEKKVICQLVSRTFATEEAMKQKQPPMFGADKLFTCLLKQPFDTLMVQARCVRVGGSTGYMAPETYSRSDI